MVACWIAWWHVGSHGGMLDRSPAAPSSAAPTEATELRSGGGGGLRRRSRETRRTRRATCGTTRCERSR
eukprot:3718322-Prymnesium_polylepis.1